MYYKYLETWSRDVIYNITSRFQEAKIYVTLPSIFVEEDTYRSVKSSVEDVTGNLIQNSNLDGNNLHLVIEKPLTKIELPSIIPCLS